MANVNSLREAPIDPAGIAVPFAGSWGWLLFRGVVAMLFGVAAIVMPVTALRALALVFAIYLLLDGIAAFGCGLKTARAHRSGIWLMIEGFFGVIAAVAIVLFPIAAVFGLVVLAAVWGLVSGGALVGAAIRMHRGHGRWWVAVSGVISIVWGALLLISPIAGAIVLAIWLGAYALIFGAMMVFLAFHLRGRRAEIHNEPSNPLGRANQH